MQTANAHLAVWEVFDETAHARSGPVFRERAGVRGTCRIHHHRHRQQWRHGPHAEADGRLHRQESRHPARVGHARGERAARARHHRHRHQGRPVRRHDDRHLRSADLGQAGLAAAARQSRRRLRRPRHHPGDRRRPVGRRQALCRAVLRRELLHHVPHRPDGEGRAHDARRADLGVRRRRGAQDDRPRRRHQRHLPARQGRLGREHGLPDGHRRTRSARAGSTRTGTRSSTSRSGRTRSTSTSS